MKTLLSLLVIFSFTNLASAKSVVCDDKIGKDAHILTQFNSATPSLESVTTYYNKDGSMKDQKASAYLSSTSACANPIDFAKDCKSQEHQSKLGYEFKFICAQAKLNGIFTVDQSGDGQFTCNDEVTSLFFNCVVQ